MSEQRLLDQVRQIKLKGWITEIDFEEMKRKYQERKSEVTDNRDEQHYDMIPHSWIRKTLEMFGIADNVRNLMRESTQKWNTELTAGGRRLGNVRIRCGVFQGDSLSPLLFVIPMILLSLILWEVKIAYDLGKGNGKLNHLLFMDDSKLFAKNENKLESHIHTVRIFSDDIRMEFGLSKCALLIMKRGDLKEVKE